MGKDMETPKKFFPMPGIHNEIVRFRKLLKSSPFYTHILIRGPRGVGKTYFLRLFEKLNPSIEVMVYNCAAIPSGLSSAELFGYIKGAFTGAGEDTSGIIQAASGKGKVLILEEFNSLARADQAKLLVFMETGTYYPIGGRKEKRASLRIIATSNYETDTINRQDVIDRFGIVVDVPPLFKRRDDIFYYIGRKFPELMLTSYDLLQIYSMALPGNFRELDRLLLEYSADLPGGKADGVENILSDIGTSLLNAGITEEKYREINKVCFGGIIPDFLNYGVIINSFLKVRVSGYNDAIDDTCPDRFDFSRYGATEILRYSEETTYDTVDYRVVETFFKLFFGRKSIISEKAIYTIVPLQQDILSSIESYRCLLHLDNWEAVFSQSLVMHELNRNIVDRLLLVLEKICRRNLHNVAPYEINAELVAEYLLNGDGRFLKVMSCIKEREGHGGQKALSDILGISTTTISRWFKKV